jgi:ABC-2 type transport system permease protein
MLSVIRTIIRKEFIQLFRDKRMILPLFVAPVIQLILFGFATTVDIKNITLAVVDNDRTQDSRAYIASFVRSGYFEIKAEPESARALDGLLDAGTVQAAIVIPPKFGERIAARTASDVQVLLDGTDSNTATIIQNYVDLVSARFSESLIVRLLDRRPGGFPAVEPRIWYNPELKTAFWMVPGVICLILLVSTLVLTSMAITREREMGTLEQLIVSPIRSFELILGKTLPFALIGFVDVILVMAGGRIIFNVPIRGSIPFLLAMSLAFILTTLGIGLFISTISRTQSQAMMSAIFFIMPAMLLSGIFTPIDNMPVAVQYITYLNPLRYFGKIVRDVLLKGNGLSILWPDMVYLLAFGVATFVLASWRFHKRLE